MLKGEKSDDLKPKTKANIPVIALRRFVTSCYVMSGLSVRVSMNLRQPPAGIRPGKGSISYD